MANALDNIWRARIELIILEVADEFDIRVLWDRDTANLTGALAIAGGLLGGYEGGKVGTALGVGLSRASGLGTPYPLREIWDEAKEKTLELFYIVYIYVQKRFGPVDDDKLAYDKLKACSSSKRELATGIKDFLAKTFGGVQ